MSDQLLPNNFQKKSPSLVAFALILEKFLRPKSPRAGSAPPGLNRVIKFLHPQVSFLNRFCPSTRICFQLKSFFFSVLVFRPHVSDGNTTF